MSASKGQRRVMGFRIPRGLFFRIKEAAKREGLTINDWCAKAFEQETAKDLKNWKTSHDRL